MPDQDDLIDILKLLAELEARVLQDPLVAAEWRSERAARLEINPSDGGAGEVDPATELLFREWFLLERTSEVLGSVPAQAWAPREVEPESPWARLLDNFLGLFRVEGVRRVEGAEVIDIADLWSGRLAHVDAAAVPEDLLVEPEDGVLLARLITGTDAVHMPLPAARWARAPKLAEAIEQDLALARHHQPRAQLSQMECLSLLSAATQIDQNAEEQPRSLEDLAADLDRVLENHPEWDLSHVLESLGKMGIDETLAQLAFDTSADLEKLRRLLPSIAAAAEAQGSAIASRAPQSTEIGRDEALDSSDALAAFDRARASGKSLDEAFLELEESLGLEPGTSLENPLEFDDKRSEVGPDHVVGLQAWIQSYLWEVPEGAREADSLAEFARVAEMTAGKAIDAADLKAAPVLGYFMSAQSAEQLESMRKSVHGFLVWAAQEQDADLGNALDDWAVPGEPRLASIVQANADWMSQDLAMPSRVALAGASPARVLAEGNELAAVEGIGPELDAQLRQGDLLLGQWQGGKFRAARVLPKEAIPAQPESADPEHASEELN